MPGNRLETGALYKLCSFGVVASTNASIIWDSHAPSRVKFFGWLLTLSRVHTRGVLLRKTIVEVAGTGCPLCDDPLETASHMALHCPVAARFWATVGVTMPPHAHVRNLHLLQAPPSIAAGTAPAFVLLCCWHLWKQRNAALCRDDAALWRGHFPAEQQPMSMLGVAAWEATRPCSLPVIPHVFLF